MSTKSKSKSKSNSINVLMFMGDTLEQGLGGLSTHVNKLLKFSEDKDVFFHIIGKEWQNYTEGKNYNYYPIKKNTLFFDNFNKWKDIQLDYWEYFLVAQDILSKNNIDVIHACDWSTAVPALYLKRHYGIPLLSAFHLSMKATSENSFYSPNVDKMFFAFNYDFMTSAFSIEQNMISQSDYVTFVSKDYMNYFAQYDFRGRVIYNGIDIEDFANVKEINEDISKINKFKLLFVGRLAEMKGIIELLKADLPEDTTLIFMGSERGGDVHVINMVKTACMMQPEKYIDIGYKTGEEKIKVYNSVDAVIMPSLHEPFGIVALEALASKKILISSRVNGLGEFLTNENSIFCNPHRPETIQRAIDKIKNMNAEDKLNIINNGFETAKSMNWVDVSKQYYNIYNEIKKI